MKKIVILSVIAIAMVGCASLKQAKDDVQTGLTTPLRSGEVSPQEQGGNAAGAIGALPIPFASSAAPIVGGIVTILAGWARGRQIRKEQPVASNPITGYLGNKLALEGLVQNISTVSQGITELFKKNSPAQHAWQGAITGLVGILGSAVAVPQIKDLLVTHPSVIAWVPLLTGLANGVQQALSGVLPVSVEPSQPLPPTNGVI